MEEDIAPVKKDWRFWIVFLSCCFLALLVSLDGTAVTVALPRIVNELQLSNDFVWVSNSYWLAGTIFQPLCAQACDIYGRKTPVLVSLAVFFVGGAVAGSARTGAALIAGRAVQGLGGGGLLLLMEVIVCDIVPLRERGKYLSIALSMAAVGAITGPPLGGAIANSNWRWIFYMNLPVSALIFCVIAFCMRVRYEKMDATASSARIDWFGTLLFAGSITSLLIGLIFGGAVYSWNSWHVIVPIVLGLLGWIAFHVYESYFCPNPAVPKHLFTNRTSVAGYAVAFLHGTMTTWVAFQWPTYWQGVLESSPLKAGINYLAYQAFIIPTAGIIGGLVTKTGRFKPFQAAGFAILTLGFGLCVVLTSESSTVVWTVFIALQGIGLGAVLPCTLPAILASLAESDVALATGMYSFLRSFGYIWGVTISAVIFNSSFDRYSLEISDASLREKLGQGKAYQYVSGEFVRSLSPKLRGEVLSVYTSSLRVGWEVAAAFAGVAMLVVFTSKHVTLRSKLVTKYGLEKGKDDVS